MQGWRNIDLCSSPNSPRSGLDFEFYLIKDWPKAGRAPWYERNIEVGLASKFDVAPALLSKLKRYANPQKNFSKISSRKRPLKSITYSILKSRLVAIPTCLGLEIYPWIYPSFQTGDDELHLFKFWSWTDIQILRKITFHTLQDLYRGWNW